MQKTKPLRYVLFGLIFALVLVGIVIHSYILLAILLVCGILLGVIGDLIENRPTKPYQVHNRFHDRHSNHQDTQV